MIDHDYDDDDDNDVVADEDEDADAADDDDQASDVYEIQSMQLFHYHFSFLISRIHPKSLMIVKESSDVQLKMTASYWAKLMIMITIMIMLKMVMLIMMMNEQVSSWRWSPNFGADEYDDDHVEDGDNDDDDHDDYNDNDDDRAGVQLKMTAFYWGKFDLWSLDQKITPHS